MSVSGRQGVCPSVCGSSVAEYGPVGLPGAPYPSPILAGSVRPPGARRQPDTQLDQVALQVCHQLILENQNGYSERPLGSADGFPNYK